MLCKAYFWVLAVEVSRPLIRSLENVKISLPGTELPFSVVYMVFFVPKKCGISQWGPFSIFKAKKMILTQKELDYMWPLISGLGRFNVQYIMLPNNAADVLEEVSEWPEI